MVLYVQYVIMQGINTIWLQQRTYGLQATKMWKKYFAEMSSLHRSDRQAAMGEHLFESMHIYCYVNLSMKAGYIFSC